MAQKRSPAGTVRPVAPSSPSPEREIAPARLEGEERFDRLFRPASLDEYEFPHGRAWAGR